MRIPGLILAASLLLSACAERWARPGTSEAEADAVAGACRNEALMAVPPQMVWQMTSPARVERDRDCWRDGGQERCRVRERYLPAQYSQVDIAAGPRDGWRRNCMAQQGFTFQGYRPLRLE